MAVVLELAVLAKAVLEVAEFPEAVLVQTVLAVDTGLADQLAVELAVQVLELVVLAVLVVAVAVRKPTATVLVLLLAVIEEAQSFQLAHPCFSFLFRIPFVTSSLLYES